MSDAMRERQEELCRAYGAAFDPPAPGTKVGIALRTLGQVPIHGTRLPPAEGTCGWYIRAGDEASDDPDFYEPLCVEHVADCCPQVLRFLGLPPGWRFMTDDEGYEDVWFDPPEEG